MKALMAVVLVVAAGCVTVPTPGRVNADEKQPETSLEREQREAAHEAFMKMHQAWMDANAAAALSIMSIQGISDWLLTRTRDTGDPEWAKVLKKLDAGRRVELDAWVRYNKNVRIPINDERAGVLPESILLSAWLRETWAHYFELEKTNLQRIAQSMEVRDEDVYVDATGMSVLARVNKTPTHIYSMVMENDAWKFDFVVRQAGKIR